MPFCDKALGGWRASKVDSCAGCNRQRYLR
jgi:hypothetical protein